MSSITGAVITVEGELAAETGVVELDTYTPHGDAILSREEEILLLIHVIAETHSMSELFM